MPRPKDMEDLCRRLDAYFENLTRWLVDRADELDELRKKGKGHEGGDPPPPPPDLGP